jgi:peptidyl-prolyl cis-trans isomerase A (cyclophilin A)
MRHAWLGLLLGGVLFTLAAPARAQTPTKWATLETDQGTIVIELEPASAPQSVDAFVGYAAGTKPWTDASGLIAKRPLYDSTVFHRVIPGFVIQGGDPRGTGVGGPGQTTPDEAQLPQQKALHFTRGVVGLAHVPDPNANGSQFFILVGDAPWLEGRYTRIGHVVEGMANADKLAKTPRGPGDRPLQSLNLKSVRITDRPPTGRSR